MSQQRDTSGKCPFPSLSQRSALYLLFSFCLCCSLGCLKNTHWQRFGFAREKWSNNAGGITWRGLLRPSERPARPIGDHAGCTITHHIPSHQPALCQPAAAGPRIRYR
ncbi:hypothetical protein PFLUV_G00194200 [Perca fluviatilis]|uniref:Uncharacterized protein n=1 Tax=Perca fluviatilis TaxID=8168 RepID=A0A6A5ESX6_PERFL|nr:hypothetical protein PFLUV_G00194200 [Perca fluviatilis]